MQQDPRLTGLLREGIEALNNNHLEIAQGLFAKAVALEAGDPVALYLLGLTLCKLSQWKEAEPYLRRSADISPDQADVTLQLAQCLRAQRRAGEAIAPCRKVLLQAPGHIGALLELAKAQQESGDCAGAEQSFRALLNFAPALEPATLNLSDLLGASGRAAEAETLLRAALAKPRDNAQLQDALIFQLAVSLRAQRRFAEALALLDTLGAEFTQSAFVDVQLERATILQYLAKFDGAIRVFEQVLEKAPAHLNTHLLLNEALYRLKRDEKFLASYDAAMARGADPVLMQVTKAGFLLKTGRAEDARDAYRRALDVSPDDPRALTGMARAAEALKDVAGAMDLHARSHERHPGNADVTIDYAAARLRQDDARAAEKLVEEALRLRPLDQAGLALRGLVDRALNSEREFVLHDFEKFVAVFDLEAPYGLGGSESFNAELTTYLESLHGDAREYFTQTLRGGTRLFGEVFNNGHRMVEQVRPKIEAAISSYIAAMAASGDHPFLSRRAKDFHYSGSWSSRLCDQGYHLNHYHSEGWISACYYVGVPDVVSDEKAQQGWIKFGQPTADFSAAFTPRRLVQPKPGRLVLFPSYMWHGTVPFSSPQTRTTIAFDVVPRGGK